MAKQAESHDTFDLAFGFLFGILAGIIAGILFAPKPGKELQEDIQDFVNNLPDELDSRWATGKVQYKDLLGRTKVKIESKLEKIDHNKKAGRMAKAKHREEMESGTYDF